MRLPEELLKCVVFLGKRSTQGAMETVRLGGTAFVTAMPFEDGSKNYHLYLVTARHSILELQGAPYLARVNTKDGRYKEIALAADEGWWFHPTTPQSVDVAVKPWALADDDATGHFRIDESLLTDEMRNDTGIGVGDEVYTVGLFTKLKGAERNSPIVRTGTIAMVPEEMLPETHIGNWRGPIEAFLIEARSVGGISGSPVFVRGNVIRKQSSITSLSGKQSWADVYFFGSVYLLGLAHGHWEIPPDKKNQVEIISASKGEPSINLGIAIVVPARKILEVLKHPELVEMRKQGEMQTQVDQGPTTQD